MKTAATLALTVMFLSAGAFAGSVQLPQPQKAYAMRNVTVIAKNQAWPSLVPVAADPCARTRCISI